MDLGLHRHDITDNMWDLIKDHLPGRKGMWGGLAHNNRRFINAVFWALLNKHSFIKEMDINRKSNHI